MFFVFVQGVLFVIYYLNPWAYEIAIPSYLQLLGKIIAAGGMVICVVSVWQIRRTLSVFPEPTENAKLVTSGLFKYARHPIYSGIILFAIFASLGTGSLIRLIVALSIWVLFRFKSAYEEKLLSKKFQEYNSYLKKTPRFFPFLK